LYKIITCTQHIHVIKLTRVCKLFFLIFFSQKNNCFSQKRWRQSKFCILKKKKKITFVIKEIIYFPTDNFYFSLKVPSQKLNEDYPISLFNDVYLTLLLGLFFFYLFSRSSFLMVHFMFLNILLQGYLS
jgi:hypothetical protein